MTISDAHSFAHSATSRDRSFLLFLLHPGERLAGRRNPRCERSRQHDIQHFQFELQSECGDTQKIHLRWRRCFPDLTWTAPPAGTQSFALIADDPDAPVGTWTHWVLYDLPAQTTVLPEGVSKVDEVPSGGRQGRNDFRKIGYGGPCPPPGKPHRYFFKLYALDRMLNLKPGSDKQEVEQAMQNHVLGKAELMGKYQR